MRITEVNMNVLCAPQGYYLAQAISRDMNFKVGLPAQFDKAFDVKEKLEELFDDGLLIGNAYLTGNLISLVVKDSSYDTPDQEAFIDALSDMRELVEIDHVTKLAIPKLCCGRNGFDWEDVKEAIEFIFDDCDIEIMVCYQ